MNPPSPGPGSPHEHFVQAMLPYARLYEGLGTAGTLPAFAEAAHDDPVDLGEVDLRQWRLLKPEYQDLDRVRSVCEQFALKVIKSHADQSQP